MDSQGHLGQKQVPEHLRAGWLGAFNLWQKTAGGAQVLHCKGRNTVNSKEQELSKS